MTDAIQVNQVSKRFGALQAVDGIEFSIPRGSLCGFLGPNGAGKSTTIRMIMSIIYPDSGSISVMGGSALDRKDAIGYLPEERGVYRKMPVAKFIGYIAKLKGVESRGLSGRIDSWLERMELPGVARKKCQELSKGMQQKVQFIASVIHEPDLVILDEPFSGLDPVNARLLGRTIKEMNDEGRTIIFSTHVLHQAEQLCDRVLMINGGRMVLDGDMQSIRDSHDPREIVVELAGRDDAVSTRLESLPGVRAARVDAEGTAISLNLNDEVDLDRVIPRDLLTRLTETAQVRSVELRRPTLDDIFVRIVGSTVTDLEARDQSGLTGGSLNKIVQVAWREVRYTALTPAFLLGVVGVPIAMVGLLMIYPLLLAQESRPLEGALALVDPSGRVAERAEAIISEDRLSSEMSDEIEEAMGKMPIGPGMGRGPDPLGLLNTSIDVVIESYADPAAVDQLKDRLQTGELVGIAVIPEALLEMPEIGRTTDAGTPSVAAPTSSCHGIRTQPDHHPRRL